MPYVPPELPAVAPVAKPRCPPCCHVSATQILALAWSALSRWNVAHQASGIATWLCPLYVLLPVTSFRFAFPCVPPCAVEMLFARCGGMVDGGLTGIPVTSRDHVWHKFPALILTSNGHLSKMPPSIATKGRGKMTSTHKLSNADVHSGGTSAPQVSTNKINPHPGDLSFIDVPGSINTFWLSINNWGEIAGVEGINDAGVIVGEAALALTRSAFCTIPV